MTSVSGRTEPVAVMGSNTAQDAANSLLAINLPAGQDMHNSPGDFYDDWPEPDFTPEQKAPRDYAIATWLDAIGAIADRYDQGGTADASKPRIASINSDDNGLYRMFIGVSP